MIRAFLALTLTACTPLPPDPSGSSTSSGSGDATDGVSETGAPPLPTTSSASSTASSSTTGSSGSTTGSESSTGDGLGGLYDPCKAAAECDPIVADGCAEGPHDGLGFCSLICTDGQCPADESGLGVPTCIPDLFDTPAACALTCPDGVACPPDLECVEFRRFKVCM